MAGGLAPAHSSPTSSGTGNVGSCASFDPAVLCSDPPRPICLSPDQLKHCSDALAALKRKLRTPGKISQEFDRIQDMRLTKLDLLRKCRVALHAVNLEKNRYADVIPYDNSRVVLNSTEENKYFNGDYINASFITAGFSEHLSRFIATQGPLSETFEDFWEMVIQYHCPAIVMLTAVDNPKMMKKCADYFQAENGTREFGKISLRNKWTRISESSLILRCLEVNRKEVFLGFRSRVGMPNLIEDGLSWTILRCNHDDHNVYSPVKIALMAECNSKLAIALTLMEECFLPMVDPRTGIDIVPHVLYNWGSSFARLNYQGFYSIILEKGDVLISVASIRVHGVKVAEMPLIATCGLQRRQGMCKRLLNAIETMLRSFKVEMIVLSAIPSLVETWMVGFGFTVIDAEEKKMLDDINLILLPGTVLLKKKLCDASFLEPGTNDQFCSTQDESPILVGFDRKKHVETGQWPSDDGGLELDVESTF